MKAPEPTIRVNVDVTNPGQFFACCGLLELADRLWPGAEGWFESQNTEFALTGLSDDAPSRLFDALSQCEPRNTMTAEQVSRLKQLTGMSVKQLKAEHLDEEKKALDKLWRESAVLLGPPFRICLNWFLDDLSGGSTFKTWAGQQSVIDIFLAMMAQATDERLRATPSRQWLAEQVPGGACPFNLDAALGNQGSDRDVGFSLDPLKLSTGYRPMVEFLGFIGLQRCRPAVLSHNRYTYSTWSIPLLPELAAPVACGATLIPGCQRYGFSLLYRTKYLKSFLPAIPYSE